MKRIIYPILISLALISGCAKVTQEGVPCSGLKPTPPQVSNTVITPGSSALIYATTAYTGASIIWTGPNNFVQTNQNGYINLDFSASSNYGLYTASVQYNGCISNPDTFYVTSSYSNNPGSPPCTISSNAYNILQGSNGLSFQLNAGTLNYSSSYYCSNAGYDISSTTTNGMYYFDFGILTQPVSGIYYNLVPSCSNLSYGQAYVSFSNGYVQYYSYSGKAYINTIGGYTYITFCGATFFNVTNSTTFTVNGNMLYQ